MPKSRKTHTSAKLLRRLPLKRRCNLEPMRHIAGAPLSPLACCALPAARATIWQVSCTVSTCASTAFSSSLSLLTLRNAASLPLSPSRPAFVALSLHFPSLFSPFFFAFICWNIPPSDSSSSYPRPATPETRGRREDGGEDGEEVMAS